jgi:hypothetical protein
MFVHSFSNSLYNLQHPFPAIHSEDEHRMINSSSNTNSYSTFYAFFFFFSDNSIANVASKQQTTALFLTIIETRTRRHTELTKKLTSLTAVPQNIQFSFSCSFFTQLNCTV